MANALWSSGVNATHAKRQSIFGSQHYSNVQKGYSAQGPNVGVQTDTQPATMGPGDSHSGDRWESWFDLFYFRIHLIPSRIALGNVVSNQSVTFELWNAFLSSKSYTNLATTGVIDGLTLNEPITPPDTLPPLESYIYELGVDTEGPAKISAAYQWTIDGIVYELPVTGDRVVVMAFSPNWRNPVDEGLEWLTRIHRSQVTATEQTASLRNKPRRDFSYLITREGDEALNFDVTRFGWQGRPFAVPVWTDPGSLTSAAAVDDESINIDTDGLGFVDGGLGILYIDYQTFETFEIDTVSAGSLSLNLPLQGNWPNGTKVYPAVIARMLKAPSVVNHTDSVLEAQLSFACDPKLTDPHLPVQAIPNAYQGLDMITVQPDWSSPLRNDGKVEAFTVGPDSGVVAGFWDDNFVQLNRAYRWVQEGRANINAFRSLLGRVKGRKKPFWVPSWRNEWQVVSDITDTDAVIVVKNNGWKRFLEDNSAFSHLLLIDNAGNPYPNEILSIFDNEDGTYNLGLSSQVGANLSVSDIRWGCHLGQFRFASDRVRPKWLTTNVVSVTETLVLKKPS